MDAVNLRTVLEFIQTIVSSAGEPMGLGPFQTWRRAGEGLISMIAHLAKPVATDMENDSMARDTYHTITELGQLFKLLSDDTRLRILYHLSRAGELHVRALCERLEQSQPAVSHHLALLRVNKLIEPRKDGKHNYYRICPKRFDQMLKMFFAVFPQNGNKQIKFNGHVLSYSPLEEAAT